jgi:hypothetical protein
MKLSTTLGFVAVVMMALVAVPAHAQITANGPYYATPSWDQTLPASTRFVVLSNMNGEAVLDRETGLVWARSPEASPESHSTALFVCVGKTLGGRRGWRLPSVHELGSLVDPSVPQPGPTLPAGHPFQNVQSATHWSATTSTIDVGVDSAWVVSFGTGHYSIANKDFGTRNIWCVRGNMNADVY